MKALHQMNNTEKARLLADLFPQEIEALVVDMRQRCIYIREHAKEVKGTWNNGFMPFDFWHGLAAEAESVIEKYGYRLTKNTKVFSEQLFFGQLALFTNDCIVKYASGKDAPAKFRKAADLIFNP